MSRKYRYRPTKRGSYSRFRGRQNRGVKQGRGFNPTAFVNRLQTNGRQTPSSTINHTFADFQIADQLKRNIAAKGYQAPTPIQDQAIEPILQGRDFVGVANTGTGKTAAFLIPLIDKVLKNRNQKTLILAPTRELAMQTRHELADFCPFLQIYSSLCIGGVSIRRQIHELSRNPHFVIATPGRLQDLIRSKKINLTNFGSVVIDEADRMVDIGFIKDIKYLVSLLPQNRQSLFFSATIDGQVQQILRSFVRNPVIISVKTGEIPQNVTQQVINVHNQARKIDILHDLLIKESFDKVLVFVRTKRGVQKLSDELANRGFRTGAIHGNKRQNQRTKTLERFKSSQINILIATDVASRGLDIPNVSHVINYDLPESKDTYIHRIGRTGRADCKGVAVTLC